MIAAAQARQSLEQLGLAEAAAVLDGRLETAAQKQLPYADFLADLLSTETAARRQRYLRTRTRLAHLPFHRTLDQFDFRFQPSIDKRQVRDLATLTFIAEAANVLFLGPPGVGKTHLAIALGLRATEQGSGVYFVRAHELLEDLRRAQAEHRLDAACGSTSRRSSSSSTSSAYGRTTGWPPPPSSRSSRLATSGAASS